MGVSVTVSPTGNLEVAVAEDDAACGASKASWMELLAQVCLEVLAFNTAVAGVAKRSVKLVVMLFAKR